MPAENSRCTSEKKTGGRCRGVVKALGLCSSHLYQQIPAVRFISVSRSGLLRVRDEHASVRG